MNSLKRVLVMLFVGLMVIGCGIYDPADSASGKPIKMRCIDGVKYIFFRGQTGSAGWGYMSVKFNADGAVSTCSG